MTGARTIEYRSTSNKGLLLKALNSAHWFLFPYYAASAHWVCPGHPELLTPVTILFFETHWSCGRIRD